MDARFLYYWMASHEFRSQVDIVAGQTDMAEYVNLRDQRRMRITAPPVPEQRAIAHVLGTLDDKIDLNRRMNETLEAMVRALFTSWFVDFEPVRAKMAGRDTGLQTPIDDLFPIASLGSEIARYRKDGATERFAISHCSIRSPGLPSGARKNYPM